jgi:hypothetical protein
VNAVMNLRVPSHAWNFILTANRLASQEGLCSTVQVTKLVCEKFSRILNHGL